MTNMMYTIYYILYTMYSWLVEVRSSLVSMVLSLKDCFVELLVRYRFMHRFMNFIIFERVASLTVHIALVTILWWLKVGFDSEGLQFLSKISHERLRDYQ